MKKNKIKSKKIKKTKPHKTTKKNIDNRINYNNLSKLKKNNKAKTIKKYYIGGEDPQPNSTPEPSPAPEPSTPEPSPAPEPSPNKTNVPDASEAPKPVADTSKPKKNIQQLVAEGSAIGKEIETEQKKNPGSKESILEIIKQKLSTFYDQITGGDTPVDQAVSILCNGGVGAINVFKSDEQKIIADEICGSLKKKAAATKPASKPASKPAPAATKPPSTKPAPAANKPSVANLTPAAAANQPPLANQPPSANPAPAVANSQAEEDNNN